MSVAVVTMALIMASIMFTKSTITQKRQAAGCHSYLDRRTDAPLYTGDLLQHVPRQFALHPGLAAQASGLALHGLHLAGGLVVP